MVEVRPNNRGASPPKPMLGSKSSQPGKTKQLQLGGWEWRDGNGSWDVGRWKRAHPSRYPARRIHNRKGADLQVQLVDLQECCGSGWLQGCHRCAFRNGNGVGNREGTRSVSTGGGTFGRRIRTFHREKKETHKNKHYPGRW